MFTFWKGIYVEYSGFLSPDLAEPWCLVNWSLDVPHPGSLLCAGSVCVLRGKNRLLWLCVA